MLRNIDNSNFFSVQIYSFNICDMQIYSLFVLILVAASKGHLKQNTNTVTKSSYYMLSLVLYYRAMHKNIIYILHFTFLFSLFVFVIAAGHYFRIWTGQVPALFQIKSIIQQIVHVTSGHMTLSAMYYLLYIYIYV